MSEPMADMSLLETETETDTVAVAAPAFENLIARMEAKFRLGDTEAIHQAHRAGLAAPVLGENGQTAWLHPDGSVRATRDTSHGGGHQ